VGGIVSLFIVVWTALCVSAGLLGIKKPNPTGATGRDAPESFGFAIVLWVAGVVVVSIFTDWRPW
jgi:hypothetical protein